MKLHSMNFFQPLHVINQIISTIVKGSLSEMKVMRASCRALWMPWSYFYRKKAVHACIIWTQKGTEPKGRRAINKKKMEINNAIG